MKCEVKGWTSWNLGMVPAVSLAKNYWVLIEIQGIQDYLKLVQFWKSFRPSRMNIKKRSDECCGHSQKIKIIRVEGMFCRKSLCGTRITHSHISPYRNTHFLTLTSSDLNPQPQTHTTSCSRLPLTINLRSKDGVFHPDRAQPVFVLLRGQKKASGVWKQLHATLCGCEWHVVPCWVPCWEFISKPHTTHTNTEAFPDEGDYCVSGQMSWLIKKMTRKWHARTHCEHTRYENTIPIDLMNADYLYVLPVLQGSAVHRGFPTLLFDSIFFKHIVSHNMDGDWLPADPCATVASFRIRTPFTHMPILLLAA